jgi:hypothetical protein
VKIVLGTKLAKPPDQGGDVDSRRARLQLRLLRAVLRAARPNERADVAERAAPILQQVAVDIHPEEDPELANLLEAVRAEMQGAVRKG